MRNGVVVIERHLRPLVLEALGDTRVVVVVGARQVGKSTLVQQIATADRPARVLTLDDQATRRAALEDPTGFVAGLRPPVVIDEVQRAPDLLLAPVGSGSPMTAPSRASCSRRSP